MNDGTLVVGVVSSGVVDYLEDYMASLSQQSCSEFGLLLAIDDNGNDVNGQLRPGIEIRSFRPAAGSTPAQIREKLIEYSIQGGFLKVVFTDCDDYFSEDRVQRSSDALEDCDLVFNELTTVDSGGKVLANKVLAKLVPEDLGSVESVLDRNFVGLTNSGCRNAGFEGVEIPQDIIAVDWWLHTIMILNQKRIRFLRDVYTFYRQTDNNSVGMKGYLSSGKLDFGVEVKLRHYSRLAEYCRAKGMSEEKVFSDKLQAMIRLKEALLDGRFKQKYLEGVNANYEEIFKGWWSDILPEDEWRKHV